MSKENIIRESELFPAGWFQCGRCGYYISLRAKNYYKAAELKQNKKPIICSTCDPKNGLEPDIRRQVLVLPGSPGDGF